MLRAYGYRNDKGSAGERMEKTTKHCPECGNTNLALIKKENKKVCTDCNLWIDWYLDEGQKELK